MKMKTKKKYLKNPFILALFLFAASLIIGFVFAFGEGVSGFSLIIGFALAVFLGYVYTSTFREVMGKKLRFNTSLIYVIIETVVAVIFVYFLFPFPREDFLFLFVVGMIGFIISFVLTYWGLGLGGKSWLNAQDKSKNRRRKNSSKKQ